MTHLHFCANAALKLLDHSFKADAYKKTCAGKTGPGFLLVGDNGVYLMSTGLPMLPNPLKNSAHQVVYAKGCNPDEDPFDCWWNLKRRTFGGDDGVDFLPMTEDNRSALKLSKTIRITFDDNTLSVVFIK